MTKRALQPAAMPTPASYSPGVEAQGRMVFVSGLVSIDEHGKTVAPGDIKGQTRQVLANIEKVLAQAGGNRDNVVKVTVYLPDLANYPGMAEVRAEFFRAPFPASAAVQARLINPEWLVEIDAIAMI
jgi:2-iminobutanoate/2-iminopropanoate deaminase